MGRMPLITLFQFPTYYSTLLLCLLQTAVLCLILYSSVVYVTFTHYLQTILLTLLLLLQSVLFWTTYHRLLRPYSFQPLTDMSTASSEPCSTLTFLLTPLSYFLFFDTYHILLHIFQYLLLLLATSSIVFHSPPYLATSIS